jgi:DNA-binding PadR family transcriptional regulator
VHPSFLSSSYGSLQDRWADSGSSPGDLEVRVSSGGHGRGRAQRGAVHAAIVALLSERPMHGYEIMQEISDRTHGMWCPSPGSVYPALRRLGDTGLIASQQGDGRRVYSLTRVGRAQADRQPSPQPPWEKVAEGLDPALLHLSQAMAQFGLALAHVVQAGTESQQAKALQVLAETRWRLHAILTEEG